LKSLVIDSFVFSVIKSFTIIIWYFLSNYFLKQRKVTTITKLKKWYYVQYIVWFICFALQIYYSAKSLTMIAVNNPS